MKKSLIAIAAIASLAAGAAQAMSPEESIRPQEHSVAARISWCADHDYISGGQAYSFQASLRSIRRQELMMRQNGLTLVEAIYLSRALSDLRMRVDAACHPSLYSRNHVSQPTYDGVLPHGMIPHRRHRGF